MKHLRPADDALDVMASASSTTPGAKRRRGVGSLALCEGKAGPTPSTAVLVTTSRIQRRGGKALDRLEITADASFGRS